MKNRSNRPRRSLIEILEGRTLFAGVGLYGGSGSATETAAASIVATQLTPTTFQYALTLNNTSATPSTATNQVGTFWFAWVPGEDFLDTAPLSVSSPTGWSGQITNLGGSDGFGIQWVASSNAVKAGKSLTGFEFTSTDTPAQVFGTSNFYPQSVNTAFVYAGAPETDAGFSLSPASSVAQNPPATPTGTETASAKIVASQLTDTTYQYSLTLKNTGHGKATAENQLGTFWYAWIPHQDYLLTNPLTVNSPPGWTDKITNDGPSDGFAIQWVATSNAVQVGKSLTGFSFTTTDTPAQVFGNSAFFPSATVNTSFVYAGAPLTDTGFQFNAVGSIADPTGALLPELAVSPMVSGTTVPANGDVNPYGVAFVPKAFAAGGLLASGDVLVSNFNNSSNLQGTGTTIVSVTPAGATSLFYQGPAGEGLTTALGVLKSGFVLVGNVPSADGTSATVGQGSLIVLDASGNKVAEFTDPSLLDGPWDMTVADGGGSAKVFVSNVLTGTVTRLDLKVSKAKDTVSIFHETQIASGYAHGADPAAFELGPTGLVYDNSHNTLYVASTDDNAIYAIKGAGNKRTDGGIGTLIYQDNAHLRGPLALALAPNGDLIAANGDAVNDDPSHPSELVEFTTKGFFVSEIPVDAAGEGGAFGLAVSAANGNSVSFAAVDDLTNSLDIWTVNRKLLRPHAG